MNGKTTIDQLARVMLEGIDFDVFAARVSDELREHVELDYDRLADKTAERIMDRWSTPAGPALVSAKELAQRYGRSPRWWRDHKDEFGGIPRGDGPRPRIDFNPAYVEHVLARRQL